MKRILLCLVLGTCATLFAQGSASPRNAMPNAKHGMRQPGPGGPGGPGMMIPRAWWKDSAVAKELKLTDQQLKQLEAAFTENRLKLIDLRATLEKEETKLQPLLDSDTLNEGQLSSQLDAVIAARGRLEKANAIMGISMRKILTPEQWKQLRQMHPRGPEGHDMRGPGLQGRGDHQHGPDSK